jgi:hypothetical protein
MHTQFSKVLKRMNTKQSAMAPHSTSVRTSCGAGALSYQESEISLSRSTNCSAHFIPVVLVAGFYSQVGLHLQASFISTAIACAKPPRIGRGIWSSSISRRLALVFQNPPTKRSKSESLCSNRLLAAVMRKLAVAWEPLRIVERFVTS